MFNQYPYFMTNTDETYVPPCMRSSGHYNMNPATTNPPMNLPMNPPVMNQPMNPEPADVEEQIEMMYPNTYFIIYPEVVHHCDMYDRDNCGMKIPSNEEFEDMVEEITKKVEPKIEENMKMESRDGETRQLGFGGRGLLRDFAGALLLRELFHRRHRPFRHRRPMHHPYMGY